MPVSTPLFNGWRRPLAIQAHKLVVLISSQILNFIQRTLHSVIIILVQSAISDTCSRSLGQTLDRK